MRSQLPLFIVIIAVVLVVFFTRETFYQNAYDIEINGEVKPRSLKSVREINNVLYIAVSYLEDNTGMQVTIDKSSEHIAVTGKNKSVTFRIDGEEAFKKRKLYFVNLRKLLEELGGKYVWDKDNKILVIEY